MSYLGSVPSSGTPFSNNKIQVLSGNGSNTQFTLDYRVNSKADIEVVVNNVQQNPFDGSYDVSNNNILTFGGAPSSGSNNIHIYFRGYSHNVSVPEANSINSNQLTITGVTAGTYGNTTAIPVVTIDAAGRITSATTNSVSGVTGVSWTTANNTLTVSTSTVAYSANVSEFSNPVTVSNTLTTKAIVPDANVTHDIGTTLMRYKDLYLANSTIYIGTSTVSETAGALQISSGGNPAVNLATITQATNLAGNAYSNAIAYSGNAALAYANAIAYSANATNISSGTVAFARLPAQYIGTTSVQSTSAAQAVSGITTLAAGNTTITGFANVTSTIQVGGAATLGSTIAVTGAATFSNTLSVAGNVTGSAANVTIVAGSFTTTFANNGTTSFPGAVDGVTTLAAGNTSITGFANVTGSLTVGGVATITGNLVVNGTTITVNTSQINTTDSLLYLASNNEVSDSIDIGFAAHYNNGAGANGHTGFIRSAVTKKYYLFQNYQPEFFANNTVDVSNTATGIQMADLVVGNLVANSTLTVTGAATFSNTIAVAGTSTFTGLITGTITSANNADYLDGQHGAYYAANSQLASYALLSGATYTGAVSGITTLAAGNTTITGFANVTTSVSTPIITVNNFINVTTANAVPIYASTSNASGSLVYFDNSLRTGGGGQWSIGVGNAANNYFHIKTEYPTPIHHLVISSSGYVGIGNTSPVVSLDISSRTDAIGVPAGNTAQRPSTPLVGMIRYNTDTSAMENYTASGWLKISVPIPIITSSSGTIYSGAASSITLNGLNFQTSTAVVRFVSGATSANVSVTPTGTGGTTATVTVPSAIYNLSTGSSVTVTLTNSDGATSSGTSYTIIGLPSGGSLTTTGGYRYHAFTSSDTFVVPSGFASSADYLIVAGGAGGSSDRAGGGGAGGLLTGTVSLTAQSYSIVVGAGGAGGPADETYGSAGGTSSAFGISATGGGTSGYQSGSTNLAGVSGGSGGGGCGGDTGGASGGSGTAGQGNAGGSGAKSSSGGGGGKSAAGGNGTTNGRAGDGGAGYTWVNGSTYAGGGGGGVDYRSTGDNAGNGGSGGGGNGGSNGSGGASGGTQFATAGGTNTGGGGGGGGLDPTVSSQLGKAGGSGIVIVRYPLPS